MRTADEVEENAMHSTLKVRHGATSEEFLLEKGGGGRVSLPFFQWGGGGERNRERDTHTHRDSVCVCVCVCVYVSMCARTRVCVCSEGGGGVGGTTVPLSVASLHLGVL